MDVTQLEMIVNVVKLATTIINVVSLTNILNIFHFLSCNNLESPAYTNIKQVISVASTDVVTKLVVGLYDEIRRQIEIDTKSQLVNVLRLVFCDTEGILCCVSYSS